MDDVTPGPMDTFSHPEPVLLVEEVIRTVASEPIAVVCEECGALVLHERKARHDELHAHLRRIYERAGM